MSVQWGISSRALLPVLSCAPSRETLVHHCHLQEPLLVLAGSSYFQWSLPPNDRHYL